MEKKLYIEPEFEILLLEQADVITSSGGDPWEGEEQRTEDIPDFGGQDGDLKWDDPPANDLPTVNSILTSDGGNWSNG